MKEQIREILGYSDFSFGILPIARSCLAEFLGIFFILALGSGSIIDISSNSTVLTQSVGIGMAYFLASHITQHVSGSHLNPIASFALLMVGKSSLMRVVLYTIMQFAGGIAGAYFLLVITPRAHQGSLQVPQIYHGVLHPDCSSSPGQDCYVGQVTVWQAFAIEIVSSLAYTLVYLVATEEKYDDPNPRNLPLSLGLVTLGIHLMAIPSTGCGLNPAQTLGTLLVTAQQTEQRGQWIYWLGPFVGAGIATLVYFFILKPKKYSSFRNREYDVTLPSESLKLT